MPLEHEIQKIVDPFFIFDYIKDVKVVYEGRIKNPRAKNLITKNSMFLKHGVKIRYEYGMVTGYDIDDYLEGVSYSYLTSKQLVVLSLK